MNYIYISIAVIILVCTGMIFLLNQAKFGKLADGQRLEIIKKSPNYRDGAFQNQSITPDLSDGASYLSVAVKFFFGKDKRVLPSDAIPSLKTDLLNLEINQDVLVWFGHSSYFIQIDKKTILVDPVLCGFASPFSFTTKAFQGSNNYSAEDMPAIDYLFITHDHWDHLDYETMLKLKPKIKKIICGLGVGAHLEHWGYDKTMIIEKDWNQQILLDTHFIVHTAPARHFSGRLFTRNQSLWSSFVVQTPSMKFFIGGDSGYDTHFKTIGDTFGPFDLVILENGQYNQSWKYIHLMPDQVVRAAKDLKAKRLFAVHNSKFALSIHAWDEPMANISLRTKSENMPLISPKIGQLVNLKDTTQEFEQWWIGVE